MLKHMTHVMWYRCVLRGSLSLKEKKTVLYSVAAYFVFGIGYASCNDDQNNVSLQLYTHHSHLY